MRRQLSYLLISYVTTSCAMQEEVTPLTDKLFVQGWLTSTSLRHDIQFSLISPINSTIRAPLPAQISSVYVEDNSGNKYIYEHLNEGTYRSEKPFRTLIERSYRLHFRWKGEPYISTSEKITPAPFILSHEIKKVKCPENSLPCTYRIFVIFKDDPDKRNYYRWRMLVDSVLSTEKLTTETAFSDITFNGDSTERKIGPSEFSPEVDIELQLWTLSQESYAFIRSIIFQTQSVNSDNIFSPVPSTGNIHPEAQGPDIVGHFGLSDIAHINLKIPAKE